MKKKIRTIYRKYHENFANGEQAYHHSRGIWEWLWFWCGEAHCGKGLISVFQEFLVSINKIFILAGGLGTRLSFCRV